jgi:imidazoleglycerol phosphate dehydratase HisB
LRRFQALTTGKAVIMGRGTLDSLPVGRPLPRRRNLVLTRNPDFRRDGAEVFHSVEALLEALGDRRGITRYGSCILPMDESLILSAVDLSGRSGLYYDLQIPTEKIGSFDTELVEEFWLGFVRKAACTLHLRKLAGSNSHHVAEGAFKSVARSLRQAVAVDSSLDGALPSTKGVL